jgi:MFS family permease
VVADRDSHKDISLINPQNSLAGPVLATTLAALGTSITNIALPLVAQGLQAPFAQVQWVVIGYLLSLTVLSAGAGRWGDRIGRANAFRFGILLFAAGALASALAPVIAMLVMAHAKVDQRGLLSGFLGLSRNLGLILGAAAIAALFARLSQFAPGSEAARIIGATSTTFAATTALLIGAIAILRR